MVSLMDIVIDRIISDLNKLRGTPPEEILGKLEKFWMGELSVILGSELIKKETLEKIMSVGVEESTFFIIDHLKKRVETTKNQIFVMSVLSAASMINRVLQCLKTSSNLCDTCSVKEECLTNKSSSENNPFEHFGDNEGGHA